MYACALGIISKELNRLGLNLAGAHMDIVHRAGVPTKEERKNTTE